MASVAKSAVKSALKKGFLDGAALAVDELLKCSRCGRCQAVCPVYLATGQERLVARGKLALIQAVREGGLEPTPAFIDTISRCLLCGACRSFCARGVDTAAVIEQVRAAAASSLGLPRLYSLLFAGLEKPALLGVAARAGRLFQDLAGVVPGAPLSLLPWVGKYAAALKLAAKPFLSGDLPAAEPSAGAVGLFVGCGANYVWPEAARAALGLLERAGVSVVVPAAQVCCGLPAAGAGDSASAAELAHRNREAFAGLSGIVALCASCAHHLRRIPGLPPVRLLAEALPTAAVTPGGDRLRVAYHAPCHARFSPAGTKPLLGLLAALPNVELLEVEDACCGFGGLFSLTHPELSLSILSQRLRGLLALHPDAVVTDCSGCLVQLTAGLREMGRDVPVVHPAQLLAGTLAGTFPGI